MIIDDNSLEKLENLSMLKIDDLKKDKIKKELTEILNYISSLNELETINIENINLDKNRKILNDKNKNSSDIIENLSTQSNHIIDNFFIVPRVIKN